MRAPRRCLDFGENGCTRRGQSAEARAAVLTIDGSLDKVAGGQALERSGGCRPVQRDISRQCGLIGGFPRGKRSKPARRLPGFIN